MHDYSEAFQLSTKYNDYMKDFFIRESDLKAKLESHKECIVSSKTKLFETPMKCLHRGSFTTLLMDNGLKPDRLDWNYFYDKFSPKGFHPEATGFYVGYGRDYKNEKSYNKLARVSVYFDKKLDVNLVLRVKEMISDAYGVPNDTEGTHKVGNVIYTWNLNDNIDIFVRRNNWPSTNVELEIVNSIVAPDLDKAIKNNKETKQKSPFS